MKKILVVVDYQNDFVDGALGFDGAEKLDTGIAEKIRQYGKGNIFCTRDTHYENYLSTREGKNLPVTHCIKDTFGWELFGKSKIAAEETGAVMIDKESFGINLDSETLSKLPKNVDSVEFVGLVSNICVVSNVVIFQTLYKEADVIVDASLTASFDNDMNDKVLDVMESFQVKIINRQ